MANPAPTKKPSTKSIIICGGSGAIGAALVSQLILNGYMVFNLDIADCTTHDSDENYHFIQVDASGESAIDDAMAFAFSKADGVPTSFVNCSGVIHSEPTISMRSGKLVSHGLKSLKTVVEGNFYSAFLSSSCFAKHLITARKKGVIVNLSSVSHFGNRGQAAYSATKAAVNSMTVAMAKELGEIGIRVTAVAPGFIETPHILNNLTEEQVEYWRNQTAIKRLGRIDEVVHGIIFCLDNNFFNGRVLDIDGGLYI